MKVPFQRFIPEDKQTIKQHHIIWCLGGAAVGRSWVQGRAFMGSIPGPGVIRHLGHLSLYHPSGLVNRVPAGIKAGCARLCWAASKIVSTILRWHPVVLRWLAHEELIRL